MADTNTSNIGLLVADTSDTIDYTAHIGNNWATIDGLMGAVDCLSTARPSNTYKGQIVYERDSKRYAQNIGTKASPSWSYMSHMALPVTAASMPTSGLVNGTMAYATDANALAIYDGTFHWKTNMSATSSARPTLVEVAATIYETDTTRSMVYDGTNWKPVGSAVLGAPTTTTSNGTATSSSTGAEIMDSVLGTYQFQAVAGRRYEVRLNNLVLNGGAGDVYNLRIRDSGSASTPTTSSTQVAAASWTCVNGGISGRIPLNMSGTFVAASTGTHTLAFFAVRASGSGSFTPLSGDGFNRELFVYDTGSN